MRLLRRSSKLVQRTALSLDAMDWLKSKAISFGLRRVPCIEWTSICKNLQRFATGHIWSESSICLPMQVPSANLQHPAIWSDFNEPNQSAEPSQGLTQNDSSTRLTGPGVWSTMSDPILSV